MSFLHSQKLAARTKRESSMITDTRRSFDGLLAEVESVWMDRGKTSDPAQITAASRLALCIDYMLANLNKPISVSTLSSLAGLSESRFFDLFKRATGNSPLNWLIRTRMQCAGKLLKRSNLRIKEIASQVGYEDQFYFSRLFKAVHGIAPREYRAQKPTPLD